jgi:hypothetical protein
MSLALSALSTPLAAQAKLTIGFAATLGEGWQIEGADLGVVRALDLGPMRHWLAVARVGSFVDQGSFIGGQRGVLGGLALGLRSGSTTIAEFGNDPDFTRVYFDVTVEVAGYVAANSPLPLGSRWVSAGVLPAIRYGESGMTQFMVLLGPTAFLGRDGGVRVFLGVRAEVPLARGGRAP